MFKLGKRNVQLYKPSIQDMVILGNLCVNIILTRNARNPRNGCARAAPTLTFNRTGGVLTCCSATINPQQRCNTNFSSFPFVLSDILRIFAG